MALQGNRSLRNVNQKLNLDSITRDVGDGGLKRVGFLEDESVDEELTLITFFIVVAANCRIKETLINIQRFREKERSCLYLSNKCQEGRFGTDDIAGLSVFDIVINR